MAGAVALGLFFASKQYVPFVAPAAVLWLPVPYDGRDALKFGSITVVSGLAITLPFVLWDAHAFFHSLTVLYAGSVRSDSISFFPPLARMLHWPPTLTVAIVATIPAAGLVLWRGRRTVSGFAVSAALILMCLFAFSPVNGNYDIRLPRGALCAAAAVSTVDDGKTSLSELPA